VGATEKRTKACPLKVVRRYEKIAQLKEGRNVEGEKGREINESILVVVKGKTT